MAGAEPLETTPGPEAQDRAYRARDPEAHLKRELLDLLDEEGDRAADERLARLRARLEG